MQVLVITFKRAIKCNRKTPALQCSFTNNNYRVRFRLEIRSLLSQIMPLCLAVFCLNFKSSRITIRFRGKQKRISVSEGNVNRFRKGSETVFHTKTSLIRFDNNQVINVTCDSNCVVPLSQLNAMLLLSISLSIQLSRSF